MNEVELERKRKLIHERINDEKFFPKDEIKNKGIKNYFHKASDVYIDDVYKVGRKFGKGSLYKENKLDKNDYESQDSESSFGQSLIRERKKDEKKKSKTSPSDMINKAKKTAGMIKTFASPFGQLSLIRQVNWLVDWMIFIAIGAAFIKDLLDWIGFSLPVINEVMNFSVAIITTLILLVLGSSRATQKAVKGMIKKWIVLLAGVLGEEIFGLNLLPIETITVAVCYWLVLYERKEAAEEAEKEKAMMVAQEA
jgi:hypothetical protein